jgi:hypothetical protein
MGGPGLVSSIQNKEKLRNNIQAAVNVRVPLSAGEFLD